MPHVIGRAPLTARRWVLAALAGLCVVALLLPGWAQACGEGSPAEGCCCCAQDDEPPAPAEGAQAERVPCCAESGPCAVSAAPPAIHEGVVGAQPIVEPALAPVVLDPPGVVPCTGEEARAPPPNPIPTYIRHRSLLL